MIVFRFVVIVFLVALASNASAQEDITEEENVREYHRQLREQFKEENLWYKIWNRYEINQGFSKYNIGLSTQVPMMTNAKLASTPIGVQYHKKHTTANIHFWKHQLAGDTSIQKTFSAQIGYFTPIRPRIGNRYMDVKGILFQPTIEFGYTYHKPHHGIYFSPGAQLQFPFALASVKMNTGYLFGRGFYVAPSASIQLDALRTLLDPKLTKTGTLYTSYTTSKPLGGGWYLVETKSSAQDFKIQDIGPFWAITPKIGRASSAWAINPYTTTSIGITGRVNFLGADIYVTRGNLVPGVVPNAQALNSTVRRDFDNSKVSGKVFTNEITFEGNLNIAGLFLTLIKPQTVIKMGPLVTPLNRFNFHLGITRFNIGKVKFDDQAAAQAYSDEFFSKNPTIDRNAINDPMIMENEWGVSYGVSYEMGAVGIKVNNKLTKTAGRGSTLEIYYMIPPTKVIKAYRDKK